jgi:eukaryotic-like serine/threonine-protein kinase
MDARTDVWSLGDEMAAGRVPFAGETPSHAIVPILESEPPAPPPDAEVPAALWAVISKALRKDKAERYQTARDMTLDLKSLKEEAATGARPGRGLPRPLIPCAATRDAPSWSGASGRGGGERQ